MKLLTEEFLNEVTEYVYAIYEEISHIHEAVKLGNEEVISRSMALKLMGLSGGRKLWFTVEFIKRSTNTIRRINGMTGVRQYVRGVGLPYNQKEKGLITIWDKNAPGVGKERYRQVPIDTITRISINRHVYKVVDDSQYKNLSQDTDGEIDQEPVNKTDQGNKTQPEPKPTKTTNPSKPVDKPTDDSRVQPRANDAEDDDLEGSDR